MVATSTKLSTTDYRLAKQAINRKKIRAALFVLPLLIFIGFAFIAPLSMMVIKSVYHPTVASLIPKTLEQISDWDGVDIPAAAVRRAFAQELHGLFHERKSGILAEELNRTFPGASSVVKSTARALANNANNANTVVIVDGEKLLLAQSELWGKSDIWQAIKTSGKVFTTVNFFTALDLRQTSDNGIEVRETQIYVTLYLKTLRIALIITILCIIFAYPLAYFLVQLPPGRSNLLMICVLLPFWTSLLVRSTAWIAILQGNGVLGGLLSSLGLTSEPIEILYTERATIIAMTHILLPFMILPLYSVMKGIDPSFLRAALSMGAKPIPAFLRVYFPMTVPGLSAGALLVFILSVGYYITPALVGGVDGQMISNIIAFHMQKSNNWELAAALGSLLLALILLLYWLFDRLVGASNIKLG